MNTIARDWRTAPLSDVDRVLCAYAEKITLHPGDVGADEIQTLHRAGLSDRAIHDAVQVIGYFNYINRVADGLGIENEDFVRPWGELDVEDDVQHSS